MKVVLDEWTLLSVGAMPSNATHSQIGVSLNEKKGVLVVNIAPPVGIP